MKSIEQVQERIYYFLWRLLLPVAATRFKYIFAFFFGNEVDSLSLSNWFFRKIIRVLVFHDLRTEILPTAMEFLCFKRRLSLYLCLFVPFLNIFGNLMPLKEAMLFWTAFSLPTLHSPQIQVITNSLYLVRLSLLLPFWRTLISIVFLNIICRSFGRTLFIAAFRLIEWWFVCGFLDLFCNKFQLFILC
jgi:hypothetical protein